MDGWKSTILGLAALASAAGTTCPPIDSSRFWLPPDVEFARDAFFSKAQQLNDGGNCVVDGWYGKTYGRFYFTVIPPGGDNMGKVISFSYEQLKN